MLPPETDIDVTVLKAQLQGYMDEGEQQSSMVQYVLDRAKQEAKKWRDNKQASYEEWLEGACEGGMRGLCKAIRSPGNQWERPCRDSSSELRPHLRRREWKELCCPEPGNIVRQDPIFRKLWDQANQQLEQLGPIQDEQVGKVLVAMSKKAMGPDGSSAQMWRPLQPDQVTPVAQAFNRAAQKNVFHAAGISPSLKMFCTLIFAHQHSSPRHL